jgi:hypothetical protein
MSQVIVTKDNLNKKREASALLEHKIDHEGQFKKWRRNDISGFDPVAAAAGVAIAPFAILFWLFSIVTKVAMYAALLVSRILGKIVGTAKF